MTALWIILIIMMTLELASLVLIHLILRDQSTLINRIFERVKEELRQDEDRGKER